MWRLTLHSAASPLLSFLLGVVRYPFAIVVASDLFQVRRAVSQHASSQEAFPKGVCRGESQSVEAYIRARTTTEQQRRRDLSGEFRKYMGEPRSPCSCRAGAD